MKVGQNDPCPCGSGKKYKKCCQEKDEKGARRNPPSADRSEGAATAPGRNWPEPPPSDPSMEDSDDEDFDDMDAFDARYEEFEEEDYEGQIALFLQTLDEEELMDEEMVFEMLTPLYYQAIEHEERDRFETLIDRLRERLPDLYAEAASFCLELRITNALAAGRGEALPALVNEMAAIADQDIDGFDRVLDQLAYHGQLSVLVEAMRIAWPRIKGSTEILPWGIEESATRGSDYEVFDYVERHPSPDARDPELNQGLELYCAVDPKRLTQYLAHLTGQVERHWTMSDFEIQPDRPKPRRGSRDRKDKEKRRQPPDRGRQNLADLSFEFLGYLRREEGMSYTRGELGRAEIHQYILDRHAGGLEPEEDDFEMGRRPQKRRPQPRTRTPEHGLCPDRGTLDRYLAQLLHFTDPQRYKAVATLELVPAWLRFLESRRLIDAGQRTKTLSELRGLDTELLEVLAQYPDDPLLPLGLERWREDAGHI